jgi:AraC-like DNA-binding protein
MPLSFRSFQSCQALQPYLNCFVSMSLEEQSFEQLLIPSSIQNLGFIFAGKMKTTHDKNAMVPRSFIVGQQEYPHMAQFGKGLEMLTVFFKPTGMHGLFGYSMQLFANRVVDFEQTCSQQEKFDVLKILDCDTIERRVASFEAFLLKKLHSKTHQHSERIDHASALILEKNGTIPIERLASELNMSRRNLERQFIERVGISPKSFAGISRIKKTLELIEENTDLTWGNVVNELEFTDQAHFIHEFRKYTGKSPGEYFKSASDFEHFIYTQ